MNKEKQIEEMAKDLRTLDCLQHNPNYSINYQRAMGLYSLGYRKASEVAREIFAEIEDLLFKRYRIDTSSYDNMGLLEKFAELKKKYTEEGK